MATLEEIGAENELALACAGYGRLRQKVGDRIGSLEYARRALRIFDRLGTIGEPERVRTLIAELN